jgi:large repetitive protein
MPKDRPVCRQLRPQDLPPEKQALNRVLVVTLSEDNTAYRGNISIYYMAPVVLPGSLPNGFLNQDYSVSLAPTAGVGPFSFALVAGAFSVGQSIDPVTGLVSGAPKSTGTFRPTVEVTAGNGTKVRYTYTYSVTIAQLSITGKAPNPVVGTPYSYAYQIAGGVGPYTLDLSSGNLGPGMSLDRTGHRIIGVPTTAGPRSFALMATDSRGVTIPINDGYEILGA